MKLYHLISHSVALVFLVIGASADAFGLSEMGFCYIKADHWFEGADFVPIVF